MTTQTTVQRENGNLLRRALRANGVFSGLSGLLMTVAANPLAELLGLNNPLILLITGVSLIIFSAALFYRAAQESLDRQFALIVIELDAAWVVGSYLILFTNWVALTNAGWWTVAIVADIVAAFAIVQYIGLRRLE